MPNYNSYSEWIRRKFPFRVQKISVDAGFSCPNRDGKVGRGGCCFCDNRSFNPAYCDREQSITDQIEKGKQFFSHKYPDMKYLAYFRLIAIHMLMLTSCVGNMRRLWRVMMLWDLL